MRIEKKKILHFSETKNKNNCYLMIFEEDLRARKQEAEKKRTRKSETELHNPVFTDYL